MKQLLKDTLPPAMVRVIGNYNGIYKSARSQFALFNSRIQNRDKYKGHRNLKLHIGCGPNLLDGFVNIDYASQHKSVLVWDCGNQRLPFPDGSVDFIFAEHFFEHLSVPTQTEFFLAECRRCLTNQGVLRLVVPDAGLYLACYEQDGWDKLVDIRPLRVVGGRYEDVWLGVQYQTKMELINSVFRQYGEHKFAYDGETLLLHLRAAGFGKAVRSSFGQSLYPATPPDQESRRKESLYVEAVK